MALVNIYAKVNTREINSKLDAIMLFLHAIERKENEIMATLDELLATVSAQSTRIASLNTLMDGIRQQLLDALSGTVLPPAVQQKINTIFDVANANAVAIDEAIAENTLEPTVPDEPEEPTV